MNQPESGDDLDQIIARSLQSQADSARIPGLAKIAINRATKIQQEEQGQAIKRQRRVGILINALAAAVLMGLLVACVAKIAMWTSNGPMTTAGDISSGQSSDEMLVAIAAAAVGVALLWGIERALSTDQRALQISG